MYPRRIFFIHWIVFVIGVLCVYSCAVGRGGLVDIDEICCDSLSRCCQFDDVFAAVSIIPPFHFRRFFCAVWVMFDISGDRLAERRL